jgi:hypothetical protein
MIFNDIELIQEAYKIVQTETIKEAKQKKVTKPDFLDVDNDNNKNEPLKKALKDKKKKVVVKGESLNFKNAFGRIISEENPFSNIYETDKKLWSIKRQINPEAQYFVHYKNGKKSKPLAGKSVLMTLKADIHDIESIEPVHKQ